MTKAQLEKTADEILILYHKYGNKDYIGEPVSQIEHMCQCAQLAAGGGYDPEVILAAFFHDIGHLLEQVLPTGQMDGFGVIDHEKIGADYLLQKGFSEKITRLVAAHVPAKRYLTFKYPQYFEQLSVASKRTLDFQGGRMDSGEAAAFEADELHPLYIQLRNWDEQAKLENIPLPSMDYFRQLIVHHLAGQ